MIGPSIPAHLLAKRSTTPDDNDETEAGPSAPSIGPSIPQNLQSPQRHIPTSGNEPQEEEEEDDYTPALPPDLVAARSAPPSSSSNAKSKPVAGPTLSSQSKLRSTHPQLQREDEEDSDDDYGPQPLPQGVVLEQNEGVREFLEKEERRRKQIEEASKPKTLKREEWMLVPPSSSDLLGSIDPTKLNKPRQFARSAAPRRDVDTTLWTETPAERQQRLADEVSGKRRRAVNADPDVGDEEQEAELRKRRKRDEQIRRGVEEHTRKNRGGTLLDQHAEASSSKPAKSGEDDEPPGIWEHGRDMALGGRLMDDKTRNKFITDARGLSDRFGTGKTGGFL
ncbi:hypothetical protein NLI96_g6227 [Meripilus lineatus]|uniref:DUF3752 domain-containing protein n=1 Tax=Meripilus lineatus TaxID=2056292 RepID=A0AAD5V6M5_9APHY|nr:hypothetical protein NLI96_g6227 [Physisporinus lineatus]